MDELINKNIDIIENKGAILYTNAPIIIKELSKEFKLGIITNNKDEYIKAFFRNTKLSNNFIDYIGTATYDISKGEAIKIMCERNKEINSIYVGDIEKDLKASNFAGIKFIHAKYGYEKDLNCNYSIKNLNELIETIKNIME